MKCILLCAGYATRLFPLTENFAKALLEIEEGKPLLDYILDEVNSVSVIDEIYVVTNDRYASHFEKWANLKNNPKKITVINDHTTNNDDRLGAIGDIKFTMDTMNIDDDTIIIAGDNLFDYKLNDVINFYNKHKKPVAVTKVIDDINLLKRFAVATLDESDRIIELVEKPEEPKSNVGVYATYIYPRDVMKDINKYLSEGNNPDAPGYFLEYVVKHHDTYAYKFIGNCYDVGTHDSLKLVRELYNK